MATNATVPPHELLFLSDGSGGFELSAQHIVKTASGISARDLKYTPSTAQTSICP